MRIFQVVTLIAFALILSATSWSEDFAKGQDAYFSGDYQTAMTEWQPLAEADGPALREWIWRGHE